jgi:murein DD-endopeptidase MepM/ murein hydrolase activator NlpD
VTGESAGNTIVIKMDDVYVLMGHLKKGSIVVKVGDKVETGQQLARMGNSGATTYPHLHIQVTKENYWGSQSLPIKFNSRYPVMNNLFIRFQ